MRSKNHSVTFVWFVLGHRPKICLYPNTLAYLLHLPVDLDAREGDDGEGQEEPNGEDVHCEG